MSVAQDANHTGLRVLVVDDNKDAARTLGCLLKLWGHLAHVVHGGADALKATAECHFDVVLLDLGMPDPDGFAVATQIRARKEERNPVLVAVTGYGDMASQLRSQEVGFDFHLVKPVNPSLLRTLLSSLLTTSLPQEPGKLEKSKSEGDKSSGGPDEQWSEGSGVHRLCQMMVEPRLLGTEAVLITPIARNGN